MTAEELHWHLEDGFPYSGMDDPFLEEHIASIEPRTEAFIEHYRYIFHKGVTASSLLDFITALEVTYYLDYYPASYLDLQAAKNTSHTEKANEIGLRMTSAYRKRDSLFSEILLSMSDELCASVFQSSELDQYREMLLGQYKAATVQDPSKKQELSAIDEEQQKLQDAYSDLYNHMTITMPGEEKQDIQSAYRRIVQAQDRNEKQKIWEKIAACYKANANEAAALLNKLVRVHIKEGAIELVSPLDRQLRRSGFDQQTLRAMTIAIKNYLPDRDVIRDQYALYHGVKKIERWDMYAPKQSVESYPLDLVLHALQKSWTDLHPDLGNVVQMMIRDGWIDTTRDPESSKQQGSFQAPMHDWPRIRFDQSRYSVHTVFHESAHALYDYLAKKIGCMEEQLYMTH